MTPQRVRRAEQPVYLIGTGIRKDGTRLIGMVIKSR